MAISDNFTFNSHLYVVDLVYKKIIIKHPVQNKGFMPYFTSGIFILKDTKIIACDTNGNVVVLKLPSHTRLKHN